MLEIPSKHIEITPFQELSENTFWQQNKPLPLLAPKKFSQL